MLQSIPYHLSNMVAAELRHTSYHKDWVNHLLVYSVPVAFVSATMIAT